MGGQVPDRGGSGRFRRVRIQEVALQGGGAAESRVAVSSTMTRACCQEIVPDCNADKVNGNDLAKAWGAARNESAVRDHTRPPRHEARQERT